MTSKQTHNRTREDAPNTERPLFLRIYRKGKRNNNPQRERGQAEDKRTNKESRSKEVKRKANTRAKGQDRGQNRGQERGQKRTKEDKIEANTPQVI